MSVSKFQVTAAAKRPASRNDTRCFYCRQAIGSTHLDECVLVHKKVKLRVTIEYEVDVPAHWNKRMIELHRNGGSWCADNIISELSSIAEDENDCLCSHTKTEFMAVTSKPFLDES